MRTPRPATDVPPPAAPASGRRRRGVLVVVAVLAVAGGSYWRWGGGEPGRRDEALGLAKAGRLAEAEPLLEAALARDANDSEVVSALALAKLNGPDPAAAERLLSRWCELRPNEARPFQLRMDLRHRVARGRATTTERLDGLEAALADGRRVLELEPANDPVRREVAWLALQASHFAEAEREVRQSLKAAPADGWLNYLLAKSLHAQGRRIEAAATLEPVVKAQPNFADALLLRAILHADDDRHDRAIPLLRQALALPNPPRRDALYRLGLSLAAVGQADEARKVMAELDILNLTGSIENGHFPNNPAMRTQIAEAMILAGRLSDANSELDAALAADPNFAPAHRAKATYYDRVGQTDRAAEHRRRAGQDAP
ncbi:MAG: tetratricopeptide repeat protein [Gemmataceae bacterium]|nr:tetratricopeptide repeat protein [Gemmataceae bacterium]